MEQETDNVHSNRARAKVQAKKVHRWDDFWNK